MYQDNIVLCGASSYEQKYYFNQDFASLPEAVKQELQIMCVLFTEDVGGILTLEFDEDGSLQFLLYCFRKGRKILVKIIFLLI